MAPRPRKAGKKDLPDNLTIEQWQVIYDTTDKLWLKRAMELTLVTGQRREDIAAMRFSDAKDGYLHVIQGKTDTKLRISTSLRLAAIDLSLDEVIRRCRDTTVSPYLVHHQRAAGKAKAGQPLMLDTLSAAFASARDAAAAAGHITLGDRPPTFHEMRSLAARLYHAEGRDPQTLLGHRNPNMTALYKDARGAEWLEVSG